MASDTSFGLILSGNRFEICAKAQAVRYDGFPGSVHPGNGMLEVEGYAMFLFRRSDLADIGVGAEALQGINVDGDIDYAQYLDAAFRFAANYHLGKHLML